MRILIKLSGESLGGKKGGAEKYDRSTLDGITEQIKKLLKKKHEILLVVGGGNLFRGTELTEKLNIERSTADYVGMLATIQNALVLRDHFESKKLETRVSSAIAMPQICEGYMPKRAMRHLQKGRVVIFAAGLGVPYFTTDSTSVQRSLEIGADMLIMAKNGVDGIYSADPDKHKNAKFIRSIAAGEVLEKNLQIADQSAIAMAKEHQLPIKIVGIDHIDRALDAKVGSMILPK